MATAICPQCGASVMVENFEGSICQYCAHRNRKQQRAFEEQQRRAASEARRAEVAQGYNNYGRPVDSYQPSSNSELGPAGQAVAGGCLLILILFFMPYTIFCWLFFGSPFEILPDPSYLGNIWAWLISLVFWFCLFGWLGSRQQY